MRAGGSVWTNDAGDREVSIRWSDFSASLELPEFDGFSKLAARLASGSHVLVQGKLVTREYERIIRVPNGKKTIEHKIQQQVVEVKANIIRVLDRSSNGSDAAETENEESGAEPE